MSMVISNVIISYPHLFTPQAPKGSNVERYSAQLICPANFDWAPVKQAIEDAKAEKWGSNIPLNMKNPLSQVEDGPYKGFWQISVGAYLDNPPLILNQAVDPLLDPKQLFAGCEVAVELFFKGYDTGSNGVRCQMLKVMLLNNEGVVRLDGQLDAKEVFKPVAGAPAALGPQTQQPQQQLQQPVQQQSQPQQQVQQDPQQQVQQQGQQQQVGPDGW